MFLCDADQLSRCSLLDVNLFFLLYSAVLDVSSSERSTFISAENAVVVKIITANMVDNFRMKVLSTNSIS